MPPMLPAQAASCCRSGRSGCSSLRGSSHQRGAACRDSARLTPSHLSSHYDGVGGTGMPITDSDLVRARTQVGDFELTVCTDGTYKLDGGAMFGVVPKTLWQKRAEADEQNRILLGLNTVVVRTGRHTVLIETGIGNKQSARMRAIHCNHELLPTSLAAAGVRVEEVDIVINTHLHFDHCGWNT